MNSDSLSNTAAANSPDEPENNSRLLIQGSVSSISGPLPPPAVLAEYDKVIPGAAERIFVMAEKEQLHAHICQKEALELEKEIRIEQLAYYRRGQAFALCSMMLVLAAIIYLAFTGHETVASILAGTTLVALVGTFVLGYLKKHTS